MSEQSWDAAASSTRKQLDTWSVLELCVLTKEHKPHHTWRDVELQHFTGRLASSMRLCIAGVVGRGVRLGNS